MSSPTRRRALGAALVVPALALAGPALAAPGGPVSVTVNGSAVALSPAPVTRAGRVFVPLRGIFERLGATVVYAGGVINATGQGNRTISLRIGSTSATVNGSQQPLDVAPFVIGASTFVPLRFVGQALGATVNFDGANQIVAITTSGAAPAQAGQAPATTPTTAAAGNSTITLQNEQPQRGQSVESQRPTISTNFNEKVDPNGMHVTLDGRDVTTAATVSDSGFVYAPSSPLQSMRHVVQVSGKDANGQSFQRQWAFTSGTAAATNFVKLNGLQDGGTVSGSQFTLTGKTLPNARVHVVAGASRSLGNVFNFGTGTYTGDTTADGNGNFSVDVSLQTTAGGTVSVDVTSTDPATKASAEQKLRLQSQ